MKVYLAIGVQKHSVATGSFVVIEQQLLINVV
jgi:hypothetical protein